jgi:hypothetical protein
MNRAIWGLAVLGDTLGVLATWPLFSSQPSLESVAWGVVLLVLFGTLLLLLVIPRLFGMHDRVITAAKILCAAVPLAVFIGSLDVGTISGFEAYAIALAILVGWLNWLAIRKHAARVRGYRTPFAN